MLQRIQSLWLFLAAVAGLATLKWPVYSGTKPNNGNPSANDYLELTAMQDVWILILTIAVSVTCLLIIFLYKNRPLQMRLCVVAMLIALVILVLYYYKAAGFVQGNLSLTSLLAVAVPVWIALAIRGIYRDEQLIKNADRLR